MLSSARGKSFTKISLEKIITKEIQCLMTLTNTCGFHSGQNTLGNWQMRLMGTCIWIEDVTCTVLTNVKWETNRNICPFCQIYWWWLTFMWKNDSSQLHWFLPFLSIWKWLPFCCFSYQLLLWFKILSHILFLRNVKSGLLSYYKAHPTAAFC